jgi:hypothetical protein
VRLDPSLTAQLSGVVLHNLAWHGHRFTIAIKGEETRLSIDSGGPLPVTIAGHPRTALPG